MSPSMRDLYTALSALPCAVTRGWPQALVPPPAIAITQLDDSLREDGLRRTQVELTLRAATPEAADALAGQVDQAIGPLGLRRSLCRDGAEKDRDTFVKTLRYDSLMPGPQAVPQAFTLTLGGQPHAARLLHRQRQRPMADMTTLGDAVPRLRAGVPLRGTATVRLDAASLAAAQAAFAAGQPVTLGDDPMLIHTLTIKNSQLELELADTQ